MFQSGRLQYWSILRESKLIGMHLSCLSVASAPSRQGRGAGQSGMPGGKCGDSSSGRRLTARIAGPHRLTAEHNSPITHHIWRRLSQQKKSSRAINSIQADWSTERHVTLSSVGKDWKNDSECFCGATFFCVLFREGRRGSGWWGRCQRALGEAFTRQVSAAEVTGGLPRVCWQPEKVSGCCSRRQTRPAERAKSGQAHRDVTHRLNFPRTNRKEGAGSKINTYNKKYCFLSDCWLCLSKEAEDEM